MQPRPAYSRRRRLWPSLAVPALRRAPAFAPLAGFHGHAQRPSRHASAVPRARATRAGPSAPAPPRSQHRCPEPVAAVHRGRRACAALVRPHRPAPARPPRPIALSAVAGPGSHRRSGARGRDIRRQWNLPVRFPAETSVSQEAVATLGGAARPHQRPPDGVLGHIFSFLPNKEAGRAAMLGRRWRDTFCSVHTISSEEVEGERADDWYTHFCEAKERRSYNGVLLDGIGAALLHRRRRPSLTVPLRSFRFAFDCYHSWDKVAVDQWLSDVLRPSSQDQGIGD